MKPNYSKVLLVMLAASAVTSSASETAFAPVNESKEVVYKQTPQGELKMHIHYPPGWKASDQRPTIVFFFGGAWKNGSPTQFLVQAAHLAGRGMLAARADYRVQSRQDATPDQCVEDAKSAVRWLRQHSKKFGIDPNRIVGSGGSAGGHVITCAAMTDTLDAAGEDLKLSSKPNVLVLFNPALDLHALNVTVKTKEGKNVTDLISPSLHIKKGLVPTVMYFGTGDRMLEHAREFLHKAEPLGNRVELYSAEGMPHGFFNRSPWKEITLNQADEFLVSVGYLKGQAAIPVPQEPKLQLKREK
jgi:acetyl esterase